MLTTLLFCLFCFVLQSWLLLFQLKFWLKRQRYLKSRELSVNGKRYFLTWNIKLCENMVPSGPLLHLLINSLMREFIIAKVAIYRSIPLPINIIRAQVGLVFGKLYPEQLGHKRIKSFLWFEQSVTVVGADPTSAISLMMDHSQREKDIA